MSMPPEDDQDNTLPRIRKAFSDFYHVKDKDGSYFIINGEHITRMAAQQQPDGEWTVTLHLSDGTSAVLTSSWARNFIREVFGKDVLGEIEAIEKTEGNLDE